MIAPVSSPNIAEEQISAAIAFGASNKILGSVVTWKRDKSKYFMSLQTASPKTTFDPPLCKMMADRILYLALLSEKLLGS
jgi:hypothetical protein